MRRRGINPGGERPTAATGARRRRMRDLSFLFLAVLVTASLVSAWTVRGLVRDHERGLLRERAAEVNLVLGGLITNVQARLNLTATVARVSNGSPETFAEVAGRVSRNVSGLALLRPAPEGFVVELAAGPDIAVGELVTGHRADAMRRALGVPAALRAEVATALPRSRAG